MRLPTRCPLFVCIATLLAVPAMAHDPAAAMASAAKSFVASLSDAQQAEAVFEFSDRERVNWHFVPDGNVNQGNGRNGLRLDTTGEATQLYAHGLLNSALSHRGYLTATSIMALEQVLAELEKNAERRDPGRYYISIFGQPTPHGTWAWRCEGHHLSINVTIKEGKMMAVTPTFFGTNPGKVQHGPHTGMEVLGELEQMAFALVDSLNAEQRSAAVVSSQAIGEIVTNDNSLVDRKTLLPAQGIAGSKLTPEQQQILVKLVEQYTGWYRAEVVEKTTHAAELRRADEWHFAWFGSSEPGKPHYFRVQSASFVLECANVQNNANHVHAVWRDFDGDFGRDLLGEHYRDDHASDGERAR